MAPAQSSAAVALAVAAGISALSAAAIAEEAAPAPPPPFAAKDAVDLAGLLAGRWDSERHGFFAREAGLDPARLAPRAHWVIRPDDAPLEHGAAFILARSEPDRAEVGPVRTTLSVTSEGELRQGFASLDGALIDCAVTWARFGDGFSGAATGPACAATFGLDAGAGDRPPGAGPIPLALGAREFWIGDAAQVRLRRARVFDCWTAILPGARHGEDTTGRSDWSFERGLLIHDQGGEARVPNSAEPDRAVRLVLRDADWTYGDRRPSLTLYVHEGEPGTRAVSYAWAEGGAERIGINLRWLQASCTVAPERTFDLP